MRPDSKIVPSLASLNIRCRNQQRHGKKIVLTHGCFDILHSGHVEYIHDAAELGSFLVIGVNSNASVKQLKGENRPVRDEDDRVFTVAAIAPVNAAVVFDDRLSLIRAVAPDVYVTSDTSHALVNTDKERIQLIQEMGITLETLSSKRPHISTTRMIKKVASG